MFYPRRIFLGVLTTLATVVAPGTAYAVVPGELHASFVPVAQKFGDATGNETATAIAVRDDGRMVVSIMNDVEMDPRIIGLMPNGQLDPSFSDDGVWSLGMDLAADMVVRDVTVQSDGKVVFAGDDLTNERTFVGRLMKDGELDPTFSGDGLFMMQGTVGSAPRLDRVLVQPDGRIVFAGVISTDTHAAELVLGRLTSTGVDDPVFSGNPYSTFGGSVGSGDSDRLSGLVRMPNGEFILGDAHGTAATGILRIGPDGTYSIAKDINISPMLDEPVDLAMVDATHVVALVTGTPWPSALAKIDVEATPKLDTTWGSNGVSAAFPASFRGGQIIRGGDNRLYVAGFDSTDSSHRAVARLLPGGTLDAAFATDGIADLSGSATRSSFVRMHALSLHPDGSIVTASHVQTADGRITQVDKLVSRISRSHVQVLTPVAAPTTNTPTSVILRSTNDGPDASGTAVLSYELAPELTLDSAAGASCTPSDPHKGTCFIPSMAAGSTKDVTLQVRSATPGARSVSAKLATPVLDDVLGDETSSLAMTFAVPTTAPASGTGTGTKTNDPTTPGGSNAVASVPSKVAMTLRRIVKRNGRIISCGLTPRGACRTAAVRAHRRTIPMWIRAVAKPLPGATRTIDVVVERKEHGRFINRGGGTLNLKATGKLDFVLPVDMRKGGASTWRIRTSVRATSTTKAAKSNWFYVTVR